MSKFCENCGAEMNDNDVVCQHCGPQAEPAVEPVVENTANGTSNSANSMDTKNIAIIGGIAVAVIVVLIIIFSIFGGGWKKPIDNYFKGMGKFNADKYEKAYVEFIADDMDIDDDSMEKMEDYFEDEYGEKIKISYKIKEKEKIKKDDLEKVQEYVEEYYEEDVKITKGYKVKVKATIKGKDKEETNTEDMYVYKVDGKWGIISESLSPKDAKEYLKNIDNED